MLPCTGTVLIDRRYTLYRFVVAGPTLFWEDDGGLGGPDGGVNAMTTSGGSPYNIAHGTDVAGPVVDATYVYWGDATGIHRRTQASGTADTVVSLTAKPDWLGVDDVAVYWHAHSSTELWRASKQTWTAVRLETTSPVLMPPVVGPGVVFWAENNSPNVTIMRSDPTTPGTATPVLDIHDEHVVMFAIAGIDLVWTARDRGEVMKMPIAGGTPTPLATGEAGARNIACSANWCYWSTYSNGGAAAIRRISPQGGTAETYAVGDADSDFVELAADATHLYWVMLTNMAEMVIARAGQ